MMNRSTARSAMYNVLSIGYTYPDERVGSWILEGNWMEEIKEAWTLLLEGGPERDLPALRSLPSREEGAASLEFAREYTRLFINAFPRAVAPPYGAIYLEKDGRIFGKTTSEVIRFYQECGFTLKEGLRDLPDHIAHELEFMGILTGRGALATGAEQARFEEKQTSFLSQFMLPWVPSFCQRIVEQSRSRFYGCLGELTKEFFAWEKNYLGIPEGPNSREEMDLKSEEVGNGKTICDGH